MQSTPLTRPRDLDCDKRMVRHMADDGAGKGNAPPPKDEAVQDLAAQWRGYVLALITLVGGSGVGVGAVWAAAGVLAHGAHLRMLGVPYFGLTPTAYSQLSLSFLSDSCLAVATYKPLQLVWLGAVLCLVLLFASPRKVRRWWNSRSEADRRTDRLHLYILLMLVVIVGGMAGLALSAQALRGEARSVLWAVYGEDLDSKGRLRPSLFPFLSSKDVRWCLLHHSGDTGQAFLDLYPSLSRIIIRRCLLRGSDLEAQGFLLRRHYSALLSVALLLLLVYLAALQIRAPSLTCPTLPEEFRAPAHSAVDVMLALPATVILFLLLMMLPANYGAICQSAVCPDVEVDGKATAGWTPDLPLFLLSPETDAPVLRFLQWFAVKDPAAGTGNTPPVASTDRGIATASAATEGEGPAVSTGSAGPSPSLAGWRLFSMRSDEVLLLSLRNEVSLPEEALKHNKEWHHP